MTAVMSVNDNRALAQRFGVLPATENNSLV